MKILLGNDFILTTKKSNEKQVTSYHLISRCVYNIIYNPNILSYNVYTNEIYQLERNSFHPRSTLLNQKTKKRECAVICDEKNQKKQPQNTAIQVKGWRDSCRNSMRLETTGSSHACGKRRHPQYAVLHPRNTIIKHKNKESNVRVVICDLLKQLERTIVNYKHLQHK